MTCTCDYDKDKFWLGCPYCEGGALKPERPLDVKRGEGPEPGPVVEITRPTFDDIYMHLAIMMSARSTCSRAKVGAVITTIDNQRVLAVGYNGGPKGLWNECQSLEPGKCGHLHAEINALVKSNYNDATQKKIYVTSSPCLACATAIINGGISEVIYLVKYRDDAGLRLIEQAGLRIKQHNPTWNPPRSLPVDKDR